VTGSVPARDVPFTILTGWLGAGKTTALNRMLAAPHGRRIAVLVNELGRIAIDTRLIIGRGGDVLELAGGCICCKVDLKSDLWDGIADVIARSRPEQVVLETTGIAEPAAILEGLERLMPEPPRGPDGEPLRGRIIPAGVICVVDAETGGAALGSRDEARAQVETADRVLLSKLDVAPADAVRRCHAALAALAPRAERASFPTDEAGGMAMTSWILERRGGGPRPAARRHQHDHAHGAHHHPGQLTTATFDDAAPLVGEQVLAVVEALGPRLVRAKGFVHLAGEPRRGFLERAGVRTGLTLLEPWGATPPRSELVFIGDDLDEAALRRALWACRAAG
jgi:G3E family GTPase